MEQIRPHDLLILDPTVKFVVEPLPQIAQDFFNESNTVVVRRAQVENGFVPVGIRGVQRSERFATVVKKTDIQKIIAPTDLVQNKTWEKLPISRAAIPAIQLLPKIAQILFGYQWGIGGSVGFELATGKPSAKMTSDLDLILLHQSKIGKEAATHLLSQLNNFGVHADLQILIGNDGFSLEEFINQTSKTMVKTPQGPILKLDPWSK